jgi:hypothetical protein
MLLSLIGEERKKEYRGVLLLHSSSSELQNLLDRKYSTDKAGSVG